MKSPRDIEALVRHAERCERDAARALGECRRAVVEAERRLAMLERYRGEYRGGFDARAARGMDAGVARDYQSFLGSIESGLAQARAHRDRILGQCREAESRWLERRGRRRALARVVERRIEARQRARARREQRLVDEFAAGAEARLAR